MALQLPKGNSNDDLDKIVDSFKAIKFDSLSPWDFFLWYFWHSTTVHCFQDSNCGTSKIQLIKLLQTILKHFPVELCSLIATYSSDPSEVLINEFIYQLHAATEKQFEKFYNCSYQQRNNATDSLLISYGYNYSNKKSGFDARFGLLKRFNIKNSSIDSLSSIIDDMGVDIGMNNNDNNNDNKVKTHQSWPKRLSQLFGLGNTNESQGDDNSENDARAQVLKLTLQNIGTVWNQFYCDMLDKTDNDRRLRIDNANVDTMSFAQGVVDLIKLLDSIMDACVFIKDQTSDDHLWTFILASHKVTRKLYVMAVHFYLDFEYID